MASAYQKPPPRRILAPPLYCPAEDELQCPSYVPPPGVKKIRLEGKFRVYKVKLQYPRCSTVELLSKAYDEPAAAATPFVVCEEEQGDNDSERAASHSWCLDSVG